MHRSQTIRMIALATLICSACASHAIASAASIVGGPTYDSTISTGYRSPYLPFSPGGTAGNGAAVGSANKYIGGTDSGTRAIRWESSGIPAVELGHLGLRTDGVTHSVAYAVNAAGTAVGVADVYSGFAYLGTRAVRWDASGTVATELGNLGTDSFGRTFMEASAINSAGAAVGYARKYSGGTDIGYRAVRWDAAGTTAIELGSLGTNSLGSTQSTASAINSAGTAVGYAKKLSGDADLGSRAVRWDATGTAASELGNLGTDASGYTLSYALAVNTSGTVVGMARKYSDHTYLGYRAVRWDATGTAASELGNLGTDGSGYTLSDTYAINTAGTAVGFARKYSDGTYLGDRAVRWDAEGTAAIELGNLGTMDSGYAISYAHALNATGTAVGYARKYSDGTDFGPRAVMWWSDGLAIDLNTLLSPADTPFWKLTVAYGISDTNWVTGVGTFDPDGAGSLPAYSRAFLLQIPAPSACGLLALGGVVSARRRR